MIIDLLGNSETYNFPPKVDKAFDFLRGLSGDIAEGRYEIQGEDIFARVMNYQTCLPEDGVIETHRKYVDIQAVASGQENIELFNLKDLSVKTAYDAAKDVEFYQTKNPAAIRFTLLPGMFAVFYPQDAHRPCLHPEGNNRGVQVKKIVLKVRQELFLPERRKGK